jgi:hypothetical protein
MGIRQINKLVWLRLNIVILLKLDLIRYGYERPHLQYLWICQCYFFKLEMKNNGYVSHGVLLTSHEFLNRALKISILFTSDCKQVVKVVEVGRNCHWLHNLINVDVFHMKLNTNNKFCLCIQFVCFVCVQALCCNGYFKLLIFSIVNFQQPYVIIIVHSLCVYFYFLKLCAFVGVFWRRLLLQILQYSIKLN